MDRGQDSLIPKNVPAPNVHRARAEKLCSDVAIFSVCCLKVTAQLPDVRKFSLGYKMVLNLV